MIWGIDNGLTGGVVAISECEGLAPIAMLPMPVTERVGEREIDALALVQFLKIYARQNEPNIVALEACPEHAKQKSTMRSMARSYGIIVGAITAALPWVIVVIVRSGNPMDSWQRKMLGIIKGDTKGKAAEVAAQIWPGETWHKNKSKREGLIDAALIAEFVRRQLPKSK